MHGGYESHGNGKVYLQTFGGGSRCCGSHGFYECEKLRLANGVCVAVDNTSAIDVGPLCIVLLQGLPPDGPG